MIVKDVSDNFGTDPGAGAIPTAHQVINEEEEGDSEIRQEESLQKQQGKYTFMITLPCRLNL